MTVRAVVFDLDGTLVDTMAAAPQAYAATVRSLGGPRVSPGQIVETWHIGPTPTVLRHFLDRDITDDDLSCFYDHLASSVAGVRPFPGVVPMLDTLRRKGCGLSVVTAATRRAALCTLNATRLESYFPVLVCGDEVSRPKPHPEGLLRACLLLGVTPTDAIYVGDSEVDLHCAVAARVPGVLAGWGGSAVRARTVARHPHDVVNAAGR
ncbi:HAD family hydrolase [Nonomuraea sp. CA-218870]|uniref:HAD family hydrolase n=1 Tax=Nonomuraea sp. CA-218870 TaxID=3239998 RepID=UPI003D8D13F5